MMRVAARNVLGRPPHLQLRGRADRDGGQVRYRRVRPARQPGSAAVPLVVRGLHAQELRASTSSDPGGFEAVRRTDSAACLPGVRIRLADHAATPRPRSSSTSSSSTTTSRWTTARTGCWYATTSTASELRSIGQGSALMGTLRLQPARVGTLHAEGGHERLDHLRRAAGLLRPGPDRHRAADGVHQQRRRAARRPARCSRAGWCGSRSAIVAFTVAAAIDYHWLQDLRVADLLHQHRPARAHPGRGHGHRRRVALGVGLRAPVPVLRDRQDPDGGRARQLPRLAAGQARQRLDDHRRRPHRAAARWSWCSSSRTSARRWSSGPSSSGRCSCRVRAFAGWAWPRSAADRARRRSPGPTCSRTTRSARLHLVPRPRGRSAGVGLPAAPVADRGRFGRAVRQGPHQRRPVARTYLPVQATDFVFAIAGRAARLPRAPSLVLVLFAALIWRVLVIGWRCRDPFGLAFAGGVASILLFQLLVNVGMVLGDDAHHRHPAAVHHPRRRIAHQRGASD